jgi:DNA-binding transcriptional ArsR family regulator
VITAPAEDGRIRGTLTCDLFARDGLTLGELDSQVDMTRFGVMKHLRLLEEAGLVVTQRSGREKRHFLNPVPIRLIHDRWIGKYRERPGWRAARLRRASAGSDDERSRGKRGPACRSACTPFV